MHGTKLSGKRINRVNGHNPWRLNCYSQSLKFILTQCQTDQSGWDNFLSVMNACPLLILFWPGSITEDLRGHNFLCFGLKLRPKDIGCFFTPSVRILMNLTFKSRYIPQQRQHDCYNRLDVRVCTRPCPSHVLLMCFPESVS